MKFFIRETVFIFALLISYTSAKKPLFHLSKGEWNGDHHDDVQNLLLAGDESNLTAKGWTSLKLQCCIEGLWMGYELEDYSGHSSFLYSQKNNDNSDIQQCTNQNMAGRKLLSVKIVGSPSDYTANAVVLYTRKWHEGNEVTYFQETADVSESFNSLIVVGNQDIELFTEAQFGGLSVCLRSNSGHIYDWNTFENVEVKFKEATYLFTNLAEIDYIFGTNQFRSFRFGCGEKTNTLFKAARNVKFE